MKAIKWILLMCLVSSAGFAEEEDILSLIEGGKSNDKKAAKTSAAEALGVKSPLRKLVGSINAEQNIFFQFIEKNDYEKALFQWKEAFGSSSFANSNNGKALYAWLLFKNQVTVSAIETLFEVSNPREIHPELVQMWRQLVPETHAVWSVANLPKWNSGWTEIFGLGTELRLKGRQIYGTGSVDQLKELLPKSVVGTPERAWLEWQLILAWNTKDTKKAAAALAHLMKQENNPVSLDLMNMTAARMLYANGYLDAAINYYDKVPKASEYWFEAQEEKSWSYMRKGEPQNAMAVSKSLINPLFSSVVGPEAYYLYALAQLKVCNYPEVADVLVAYKNAYKDRAQNLLAIKTQPQIPEISELLNQMQTNNVSLKELGAKARSIPRYVTRDQIIQQNLMLEKALSADLQQAEQLVQKSLAGGSAEVGFQGFIQQFKNKIAARKSAARNTAYERIKLLAADEVEEITQVLQRLHIVEAELLQQVSMAQKLAMKGAKGERSLPGGTGATSKDAISFPASQEKWFDEMANYKISLKGGCEVIKR